MSLAAPLYLTALAALALPWLLHRFSDTRPEERPFPSTRFLEPTVPPVSRRRRLRHRVLLALRALALAALALLFAEPWIARPEALADVRALHVIAVDTSLSMRAGDRFERALGLARERLGAIPEGDAVQLVGFDHEVRLTSETPLGAGAARAALDRAANGLLAPGFAAADYGRLMQRVDRLADESGLPTRLVLLTDVQRSALPERRNALFAPRLEGLDIVDVSAEEANVSLAAELETDDGATARVVATLHASGGVAGDEAFARVVSVRHDGETLARERVRLAPGERLAVVIEPLTLPARALEAVDVVLEGEDAIVEDDRQRLPVARDGARRIALAALDARVSENARVFVTTALEADDGARVDATTVGSGQLPDDARELVVFASLDATATLPGALERFLARGGSALVVDAAPRERGADALGRGSDPADALDETDAAAAIEGQSVGRVDVAHPLALGEIDWTGVRFFELGDYVPGERERVLVETVARRPVLVERADDGGGIALLLNERLDGVDSTLPFQPAMVELMQRVAGWFETTRSVPARVLVGETLALPQNAQVLDPDGRALIALADTASVGSIVPERPGLHTVVGSFGEQPLVVAIDPRESDLATMPESEIAAWRERYEDGSRAASSAEGAVSDGSAEPPAAVAQLALWPWLLPVLAVLLAAETLLANRRLDVRRDGT